MSFFDMSGILGAFKLFALGGLFGILYALIVKRNLNKEEKRKQKYYEKTEEE